MSDAHDLYPPSPKNVPPDLTAISKSYRNQVIVVLICLIVFVVIYLLLLAASAWLAYHSYTMLNDPNVTRRTYGRTNHNPIIYVVLGISSVFLCLYLIKGFFKRAGEDRSVRREIIPHDAPELFDFIQNICIETGAPLPNRVFVTPDVNAAVVAKTSFLTFFLPLKKDLVIGLGLVNRLNLSEFKAVLAHEFGHFSQRSMRLGTSVYLLNRLIYDLVYSRDGLDRFMQGLRNTDIRIAIFAYAFAGVLWVIRKGLEGMFKLINFQGASLSREQEFHADLVAVSVTGSDALIHALSRLDLAAESLGLAWKDLSAAAHHRIYSRDLFYHQTRSAEFLKAKAKNPNLGEPPPLPDDPNKTTQVFEPKDDSTPLMWRTHPSNYDREMNAKGFYIRGVVDDRSPWLLFANEQALRYQITRGIYELNYPDETRLDFQTPEEVQKFIDEEHAETTYSDRYHGVYDDRYIKPGDFDQLSDAIREELPDENAVKLAREKLYSEELQKQVKLLQDRQKEINELNEVIHNPYRPNKRDFSFRGETYPLKEAAGFLEQVQKEQDEIYEWFHQHDRLTFLVHYSMALDVNPDLGKELVERYRFHVAIQEMHSQLSAYNFALQSTMQQVAGQQNLDPASYRNLLSLFIETQEKFIDHIQKADELPMPSMKNMPAGEPLGPFLLEKPLVKKLDPQQTQLDSPWINSFMEQLLSVLEKAQRLHFKSLGGILGLQEEIDRRWPQEAKAVEVLIPVDESAPKAD